MHINKESHQREDMGWEVNIVIVFSSHSGFRTVRNRFWFPNTVKSKCSPIYVILSCELTLGLFSKWGNNFGICTMTQIWLLLRPCNNRIIVRLITKHLAVKWGRILFLLPFQNETNMCNGLAKSILLIHFKKFASVNHSHESQ